MISRYFLNGSFIIILDQENIAVVDLQIKTTKYSTQVMTHIDVDFPLSFGKIVKLTVCNTTLGNYICNGIIKLYKKIEGQNDAEILYKEILEEVSKVA
ncbi:MULTISPECIES: hypothetical protein [Acidianus]|uniref:Uncharacterized protein n=1 Tax=Candidatus Acidianus copahuensis TaxID=1160895 RepID=A0A031LPF1_9CREN|nr:MULTISPECIES: hypothetical protein [Acidianus]EZQ06851.1 hypothetical protein CM19_05620 [Candidatus Acidianus copahuensis]NON63636.1 hypothetical protein [Acidianus sp. RZ1]